MGKCIGSVITQRHDCYGAHGVRFPIFITICLIFKPRSEETRAQGLALLNQYNKSSTQSGSAVVRFSLAQRAMALGFARARARGAPGYVHFRKGDRKETFTA